MTDGRSRADPTLQDADYISYSLLTDLPLLVKIKIRLAEYCKVIKEDRLHGSYRLNSSSSEIWRFAN